MPFDTHATALIRAKTVVPDLVLSLVRDVLRDLGQKVKRLEHFEVSGNAGGACHTEWATRNILDKALHPGMVLGSSRTELSTPNPECFQPPIAL